MRDEAYRHAVVCQLHSKQTSSEQVLKKTRELNGLGFSSPDAPALSPIAEKLKAGEPLNEGEVALLCSRLPKYWGQFSRLLTLRELDAPSVAHFINARLKETACSTVN